MAKGHKTGGRTKGVPNKVTSAARAAFLATFDRLSTDLDVWIQQTANGWDVEKVVGRGETERVVVVREGKDPGKAADLLIRMAEYHFPKLGRTEVTGEDGGPVEFVIRDIAKEGE
jgi:hypothetical protein